MSYGYNNMNFPRHGDTEMDMDMDMGDTTSSDTSSSSMHMMSVFQTSMSTALYSETWTPNSAGTYAATIIFLIVLAMIFRLILAGKAIAEARWLEAELKRRYVVVQGKMPISEQVSRDSLSRKMTLTENGVEEDVMVVQKKSLHNRPWRISVDPLRALLDTLLAGVGYML